MSLKIKTYRVIRQDSVTFDESKSNSFSIIINARWLEFNLEQARQLLIDLSAVLEKIDENV